MDIKEFGEFGRQYKAGLINEAEFWKVADVVFAKLAQQYKERITR